MFTCGKTLITLGLVIITSSLLIHTEYKKNLKLEKEVALFKQPIVAIVLEDANRMCYLHGGLKNVQRIALALYDVQCKDEAIFHSLKLTDDRKPIKPAVLTREVINYAGKQSR